MSKKCVCNRYSVEICIDGKASPKLYIDAEDFISAVSLWNDIVRYEHLNLLNMTVSGLPIIVTGSCVYMRKRPLPPLTEDEADAIRQGLEHRLLNPTEDLKEYKIDGKAVLGVNLREAKALLKCYYFSL